MILFVQELVLGVKRLNCRYPIYRLCSRYKMNTNYTTLPDPAERTTQVNGPIQLPFRLQVLSKLTVEMLA